MSAMPLHRMRVADMAVQVLVRELVMFGLIVQVLQQQGLFIFHVIILIYEVPVVIIHINCIQWQLTVSFISVWLKSICSSSTQLRTIWHPVIHRSFQVGHHYEKRVDWRHNENATSQRAVKNIKRKVCNSQSKESYAKYGFEENMYTKRSEANLWINNRKKLPLKPQFQSQIKLDYNNSLSFTLGISSNILLSWSE